MHPRVPVGQQNCQPAHWTVRNCGAAGLDGRLQLDIEVCGKATSSKLYLHLLPRMDQTVPPQYQTLFAGEEG